MEPFVPAVHYSFNPWWGCTRVSAGCDHCYAEAMDVRAGGESGPDARPLVLSTEEAPAA